MTAFNEYGALTRVAVRHARQAFGRPGAVDAWRALNFTAAPDADAAVAEYDAFLPLLGGEGVEIDELPPDDGLTLDAIYARDASIVTPRGVVGCRMGKAAREAEPAAALRAFATRGVPIAGAIEAPGCLEGGDVVWFDERTVAVGRGYRTNADGIRQLAALLGPATALIEVPLPHHRGPDDVFHLMSILSPVDRDLAVVYSPLMPVPFREWLVARGIGLIEVPEQEFDRMGCNVLAVAPRRVVMVEGAPETKRRLEEAGTVVAAYRGVEISLKGGGGPTCLTRPLVRT